MIITLYLSAWKHSDCQLWFVSVFKVLSKLRLWNCHIRLLSLTKRVYELKLNIILYCCDLSICRVLVTYAVAIIHFQSFCECRPSISLAALLDNFVCFYILVTWTRQQRRGRQTKSYSQITTRCFCMIGVAQAAQHLLHARTLRLNLQKPSAIISLSSVTPPNKVEFRDLMVKQNEAWTNPTITGKLGSH